MREPDKAHAPKPPHSLVGGLVRGAVLWAVPVLALAAFALTFFYRNSTYRIFDDPLESAITSLIAASEMQITDEGSEILALRRKPLDPRYQQALSGRYWLIGKLQSSGRINPILSSRSLYGETLTLSDSDAADLLDGSGAEIRGYADGPDVDESLRLIARSVILPDMNDQAVIMVAAADRRAAGQAIQRFALFAVGLMTLLSAGLVIAVLTQVRVGLKPLFDLRQSVIDIREGRSQQVQEQYPPEIQPLASELNSLIQHNRDVVERARTHVGNLAHALKTPLAVLINEAQIEGKSGDSRLAELVARQSETMKNQVEHHLERARAAARGQVIGASTPVNDVIRSMERTLGRIYQDKNIRFTVAVDDGLIFRGERRDLDEMVGNLMDNACKWTGNKVDVKAIFHPDDDTQLILSVADDGPGLPDEVRAEAIKRGIRLDETTPGTGLGLSIVDDLARAYKGSFTLEASKWGGLKAVLSLPGRR